MTLFEAQALRIPVIYYHSVGPVNPLWKRNYLTLELKFFRDQLEHIAKNFQAVSLKEYWEIRNGLRAPVKNAMAITFDDGFLDNWIWAFPLLKKYGLPAAIFVSPEFVDLENGKRPNLDDVEQGHADLEDIRRWGYLSWEEMKAMEASGLISIQAHTMTHSKHFVSDRLIAFHHPGADILYPAGNLFPGRKPYYIGDSAFEKLLPYGFPLFEERSAVIAKKVIVNPAFADECVRTLKNYDFKRYVFAAAAALVKPIYDSFKEKGILITGRESEAEYFDRLDFEIVTAKKTIEEKLRKKVEFLCWPFGDYNENAHLLALKSGYLATTTGSKHRVADTADRIPERIGLYHSRHNRFLSRMKTRYKIGSYLGRFPYQQIGSFYHCLKYGAELKTF